MSKFSVTSIEDSFDLDSSERGSADLTPSSTPSSYINSAMKTGDNFALKPGANGETVDSLPAAFDAIPNFSASDLARPTINPVPGPVETGAPNAPAMGELDSCYDYYGNLSEFIAPPEDYVTGGGKWGAAAFGTTGGTVTWSLAGAGWSNTTGVSFFTGTTVALSSFLSFDYTAVLAQAFASWSAVANISFVQVSDGGGNMGTGLTANIRIGGGFIDGRPAGSSVLARAFFPASGGNAQNFAYSGDMIFDSGEGSFWNTSSFLAVASHEIGHALGLSHTSVSGSLMEPYYNPSITTPQTDDINGIRAIYGTTAAVAGSVSINDVTITEGNSGTQIMTFTVTRSGGTAAFQVNYATAANTASAAGGDYVATSGTLTFNSGVNSQTIAVTINGDMTVESTETFFVNLSGATNLASIIDGQGIGTITNDDSAAIAGLVSINDVTIAEGNAGTQIMTFTVTRSGGTAAFAVNYATANNSALTGSDYITTSGTLSFGSGVNTQFVSVTINGDMTVETDETFFVNLSGATNGAAVTDGQGVGTITNDDAASSTDDYADSFADGTDGTVPLFGLVAVGNQATGTLETNGDRDWFSVSLTAGVTYTIELLGIDTSAGTLIDPYLYLYNSAGTYIIENDDAGFGWNSYLNYTPGISGTYYISAAAYGDSFSGTYTVRVTAPTADDFADSYTDTTAPFGQLTAGGSRTGSLEARFDQDWFRVTLTAGIAYTINLLGVDTGAGTLFDPYLYLYDGAGNFIIDDDDSGVGHNSQLIYTPGISGSYYIVAESFSYDTGTYTVIVTPPPPLSARSDFNGNGTSDILWRENGGTVVDWTMANGQVSQAAAIGAVATNWQIRGLGDFNGNGTSDILWRENGGTVVNWTMLNGQVSSVAVIGAVATNWNIVGTGDFNGNGTSDILWRENGGTVVTWTMTNGLVSGVAAIGAVATNWNIVGTGDFNGDGTTDILWRENGGTVVTWSMTTGGTVGSVAAIGAVATNWSIVGTGDFNGNGTSDILWRENGGTVVTWSMTTGGTVGGVAVIGAVATNWQIRGTGDFNGDGTADILWRENGGTVVDWTMSNGLVSSVAVIGAVANNWQINNN